MDKQLLLITPQTKVGELIQAYPELEKVLIEVAPAFKKLRNPVLRRTVAKVTSLAQAARVGNVSVVELVKRLRQEVGQPDFEPSGNEQDGSSQANERPEWLDEEKVVRILDARPIIDSGEQPIGEVFALLGKLRSGEILKLVTPFDPAPLIDKAAAKGYSHYQLQIGSDEVITYFARIGE